MTVYVFGNPDFPPDSLAIKVAKRLKNINFIFVKPNQDLPFIGEKHVVLMDVVQGIDRVTLLTESDLAKLVVNRTATVHDYDLGFQLKYLKKLGKLGQVSIIGLPQKGVIDYALIQSIFRKLVEQDMHGS